MLTKTSDVNKIKKISYVIFISESIVLSKKRRFYVAQSITSILNQSMPFCDLLIVSSEPALKKVKQIIEDCIAHAENNSDFTCDSNVSYKNISLLERIEFFTRTDSRIFLYELAVNNPKAVNNFVSNAIRTEWVVFLNFNVQVRPNATLEIVHAILQKPDAEIIYADHDRVDGNNVRSDPIFKPIFSLDFLYCQNYIGSFIGIKTECLKKLSVTGRYLYFSNYIFTIVLSFIKNNLDTQQGVSHLNSLEKKIIHLPLILYSERQTRQFDRNKIEKYSETFNILNDHLLSCYSNVTCTKIKRFVFRHRWTLKGSKPLVSLIIPTKDGFEILKSCITSIIKKTTYKNYEIIIINNNTTDSLTLQYMNQLIKRYNNIRIVKYPHRFNYSDMNNMAVPIAKGEILGFINNDVEIITPDWLTELVSHAVRPDIGCVGAMHYYPDNRIQHAGVIVGMHGVADHAFKGLRNPNRLDRLSYLNSINNPDAVTAATLIVRRELFDLVGGFDSHFLKIAFNDVDLCLKISGRGYRCLWTPYAELFHFESKTRGSEIIDYESKQVEQFEHCVMQERWGTDHYPITGMLKNYLWNSR